MGCTWPMRTNVRSEIVTLRENDQVTYVTWLSEYSTLMLTKLFLKFVSEFYWQQYVDFKIVPK